MRYIKLLAIMVLSGVLLVSCKKDHYNVNNVHGINAQGEVMLPIGSKSFTMMGMMERFQIDSLITCSEDGTLHYNYYYEGNNVLDGNNLLRFNDFVFSKHYVLENNLPIDVPVLFDTVVSFDLPLQLEADYVGVLEAWMRSGSFDFDISTNFGMIKRVVLRSADITDAQGNEMTLNLPITDETFSVDIGGLRYETEVANRITFGFDIYIALQWTNEPEYYIDVNIVGHDFNIREMKGYVHTFVSRDSIDTTFTLFPSNLAGKLEINDARLRISERNLFGLTTRLEVDTAMVYAEGIPPYSLLDPMPIYINIPTQMDFGEVFNRPISGTVEAHGGRVHATYQFLVNPFGSTDVVSVADTCSVDVQIDVDVPFAFEVTDVQYLDTVDISLDEITMPDLIKKLTLDLTLSSTLPLNLDGWFYLYDSQNDRIMDTLNPEGKLIIASFDGQPTMTTVSVDITEDRLQNVFGSNQIIMQFVLDTDAHDVKLNANQELGLSAKVKIEYDGNVELDN